MAAWGLLGACGQNAGPVDSGFDPDAGACGALPIWDGGAPACNGSATFSAVKAQVFNGCQGGGGISSCHGRAPFGGGTDLTPANAYAALVNVAATAGAVGKVRVRPSDPARSFLLQKLTNTQCAGEGGPMPQGEGIQWRLPPRAELELVWCWINAGAPNN